MRTFLSAYDLITKEKIEFASSSLSQIKKLQDDHNIPSLAEFIQMMKEGTDILSNRQNILYLSVDYLLQNVIIVGDLHGCYESLSKIIDTYGFPDENTYYVFNGDLMDRGGSSYQILFLICKMLIQFPNKIFINRGNHESLICAANLFTVEHNFISEMKEKFPLANLSELSHLILDFSASIPLALVINQQTIVFHGGPPRRSVSLNRLQQFNRKVGKIQRDDPTNIWMDLLWSYDRGPQCSVFLNENQLKYMIVSHSASVYHFTYVFKNDKLIVKIDNEETFQELKLCKNLGSCTFVQEIFSSPTNHGDVYCLKLRIGDPTNWDFQHLGTWKDFQLNNLV